MLQESTVPSVRQLYGDEDMYQQDGAIPHYHRDIRTYLDNTFPERWIGRRRSVEYPPVSPDLTPPDFFLVGLLEGRGVQHKASSVKKLNGLAQRSQQQVSWPLVSQLLTAVNCAHFEHLH
jgi:hypothetical protein